MSKLHYGCEGLCAVISGGTSGIGLEVARYLLLDGARVYILGRSRLRGAQAVTYLKQEAGVEAVFVACDVASQKQCAEAIAKIAACEKGQDCQIDILVNSAGVYKEQRLEQLTEQDIASMMGVNVQGTMLLSQAALPYLHSGSCVVNVASDAGINGNYGCPLYCASKGAVVALTRALALDLAPDVRVNCVCPADVDTPLLAKQLVDADGGYTLADMATAYPLQRIAAASEVAHVICSIASPANSFMTGSIVTVDGGLTAG
jgi:NAD(P)-dependent dehydrogenase (short-subunit alcohol dehydrogenase family)